MSKRLFENCTAIVLLRVSLKSFFIYNLFVLNAQPMQCSNLITFCAQEMQGRHERYYRHDCGLAWNRTRGRYNQMNNMMSVFGLNEETFYQSHKKCLYYYIHRPPPMSNLVSIYLPVVTAVVFIGDNILKSIFGNRFCRRNSMDLAEIQKYFVASNILSFDAHSWVRHNGYGWQVLFGK